MSRNSVEVLAYSETQQHENNKSVESQETGHRKYYSQYSKVNKKYETASKFTKKFGSKDSSSLNSLYQKNTKKPVINGNNKTAAGLNNRNSSSLIPQPSTLQTRNNLKNSEKKPTQPVKTIAKSSPSTRPSQGKLSSEASKKNAGAVGNNTKSSANLTPSNKGSVNSQTKRLSGEQQKSSSKLDDRTKSAKTETPSEVMISPGPGPGQRLRPGLVTSPDEHRMRGVTSVTSVTSVTTPECVQRLISEQLARGKLPPKAKFRADDEISIGEPDTDHSHPSPASLRLSKTPVRSSEVRNVLKTGHDSYPPSQASLLVARCLEESGQGARARGHKTNSLPLHSALGTGDHLEKSTSLDKYYKAEKNTQPEKQGEGGFFQRLSNLRRSFNSHDHKRLASNQGGGKIRPHLTDSNTPFFQGISHEKVKRPNSTNNNNNGGRHLKVSRHSSYIVLAPVIPSYKPPARKYQFQRAFPVRPRTEEGRLQRSFSFSDCQVGFYIDNKSSFERNLNTRVCIHIVSILRHNVKSVTKLTISISGDRPVCGGQ